MNLFELQERLKDFSQDQLVREMQAPTGMAPQYLVLSELQRRQRMMSEQQAQMQTPQTTVAEDAIAAAGVPQGGLADMARAMAPQTDMDMNTAVQPVERMQQGGLAGVSRNLDEFTGLPPEMTDPTAQRTGRQQPLVDDIRRILEGGTDLSDAERRAFEARLAAIEALGGAGGFAGDVLQRADDAVGDAYALTGRLAGAGIEGLGYGASAILGPEAGAPILSFGESVRTSMDPIAEEGFISGSPRSDEEVTELPEIVFDSQSEDQGLSFGDEFGEVPPEVTLRGGTDALTFGDIEPTGAPIPTPRTNDQAQPGQGGVGGAGGVGAPAMDDAFEQDKWLALAQFGLNLMSSQQPTIGGAIGEAGLAGITALRQARGERDERLSAQQARADRLAAAASRGEREEAYPYRQVDDLIGLADSFSTRVSEIVQANYGVVPKPDEPLYDAYEEALANANVYRTLAREAMGVE